MYRPLVQPKFHTSRGQPISPGASLLATGGPKQRGLLVVPNPHFLRNAEGWDLASDLCPVTTRFDGRIEIAGLTDPGACTVVGTDATETLEADKNYQIILNVVSMSGEGDLAVRFAGSTIPVIITDAGTYLYYYSPSVIFTQRVELRARTANNFSAVVDYLGVSLVGST